MCADAEVMRYLGGPADRDEAWRAMALFLGHQDLRGYSVSAVVEKSTGRLVGRGGLWRPQGWPGLEVGWVLERQSWGRGYATELGLASRDFAFNELGAADLCSLIHPANRASIAVAERIGHHLLGEIQLLGRTTLMYGQEAPTYGRQTP
jgi:RimJ/RimL family protein N-acetyltransferase